MAWSLCAEALAASAANGLAFRLALSDGEALLEAAIFLFLAIIGVAVLNTVARRRAPLRETLGLPARPTARHELLMGAGIGWAIAIASVLPIALAHDLNIQIWNSPRAYYLLALGLLTLALLTLAQTIVIFGYALPRLVEAAGPARGTLVLLAVVAVYVAMKPVPYGTPQGTRLLVPVLATLLLSLCWLRTHAVWLAWALRFGWAASTAVLFGLPLAGNSSFASVVDSRAAGPVWLTGGAYGPAAAAVSVLAVIVAIPVVIRVTDDYAWEYTRPPIISGGYDVTIPPPAAHAAMEQAVHATPPAEPALVQIQPAAPPSPQSTSQNLPD